MSSEICNYCDQNSQAAPGITPLNLLIAAVYRVITSSSRRRPRFCSASSECRALTNLIGNGVTTIVVSRWEGELDTARLHDAMTRPVALGEALEREPVAG